MCMTSSTNLPRQNRYRTNQDIRSSHEAGTIVFSVAVASSTNLISLSDDVGKELPFLESCVSKIGKAQKKLALSKIVRNAPRNTTLEPHEYVELDLNLEIFLHQPSVRA